MEWILTYDASSLTDLRVHINHCGDMALNLLYLLFNNHPNMPTGSRGQTYTADYDRSPSLSHWLWARIIPVSTPSQAAFDILAPGLGELADRP